MMRITAILSMLHEPAATNSATRLFRGEPVLRWTIQRLSQSKGIAAIGILCWEDQYAAVAPIAEAGCADVLTKGPRQPLLELDRTTAAARWADGWRGGLHSTCWFDQGFYGPWVVELAEKTKATAVLLAPPASAMADPQLIDALVARASQPDAADLVFTSAAPGLAGAIVTRSLIDQLNATRTHPGRLLHYMPERPMLDPVGGTGHVSLPAPIAQCRESFLLDSEPKIRRFTAAAHALNGQLMRTGSQELINRLALHPRGMPRDWTLELTTARATAPVYQRQSPVTVECDVNWTDVQSRLKELSAVDDIRLTIGGRGDPLGSPMLFDVIALAHENGITAIHIETDLAQVDESLAVALAQSPVDVVTVFLPALTPATYARVMGIDAMARVLDNIKTFVTERARRGRGVPILVPTFVKLAENLAEMDAWYDQWLTAVGAAAIVGPRFFGSPELELADMSPARGAQRQASRGFIGADGDVIACDDDNTAIGPLGVVGSSSLTQLWTTMAGQSYGGKS
jgi:hypothetical protein